MTLNYIGSKKSLLHILERVFVIELQSKGTITIGDGFCGTGCVGNYFATTHGMAVQAVDMELYSYVITQSLLCIPFTKRLDTIIATLNADTGCYTGLITRHYSPIGNRMYFTKDNALRIDYVRQQIDVMKLTKEERTFLLASLICSADKVANVSCVYGSFLKKFKSTAMKPFILKPVHTNMTLQQKNTVLQMDVVKTDWGRCDAVYFDPPYNARQYGANYFLLNDLIENTDKQDQMRVKTGLTNYNKSDFCKKSVVTEAFNALMKNPTLPPIIFISYNNEGLLSQDELRQLLLHYGSVTLYKHPYKKFKAQQSVSDTNVFEFIWCINTKKSPHYKEVVLQ